MSRGSGDSRPALAPDHALFLFPTPGRASREEAVFRQTGNDARPDPGLRLWGWEGSDSREISPGAAAATSSYERLGNGSGLKLRDESCLTFTTETAQEIPSHWISTLPLSKDSMSISTPT